MFEHRCWPLSLSIVVVLALLLSALLPAADPAAAAASIRLSRYTATATDSVAVTGYGFSPGDTAVVYADFVVNGKTQRVQTTAPIGGNGIFTAVFTVPGALEETTTVTAKDLHNNTATQQLTIVRLVPVVVGRPAPTVTVSAGHGFYVRGGGFAPGEPVALTISFPMYNGPARTESTTVTADAHGNFGDVGFQVPNGATAATPLMTGTGQKSGRKGYARIRVLYHPSVSLSPPNVLQGSTMGVLGSGFVPNSRVHVSAVVGRNGAAPLTLVTDVVTDQNGSFRAALAIPANTRPGGYTATATDAAGGLTARAGFGVAARPTVTPSVTVSPASAIPGAVVQVQGAGYPAGDRVDISATVTLSNGSRRTLATTATTNRNGQFAVPLQLPTDVAPGAYTLVARSRSTGRAPTARLGVANLAPSVVAVPTTAAPGTTVTVNGFGFAAGEGVTVDLNGDRLGTTITNGSGQFSLKITVPDTTASGTYVLSAVSGAGRKASINLTVNRAVSTHFYFASEYTGQGYHEYLAFLNPDQTRARITITYQRTNGTTLDKTFGVDPHTRYTEDVNADLGIHVSAAAAIAADVPIAAERIVYHGTSGAVDPGVQSPSTIWYFANGNTGKGYREYVAVQNPNSTPLQVAAYLLPTHHRAMTVYRTMPPTSRTTFYVNSFIRQDAVGVTIRANGPVVANRTIYIHHGMTSKMGVTSPQRTWYFASGPQNSAAQVWIGAINPSNNWSYLTLRSYGPLGVEHGSVKAWLRPRARVGYLMNRVAHHPGDSVVITTSRPIVAEQMTYSGKMHNASTDTFGAPGPARTWEFAASNTSSSGSEGDVLTLFNPNLLMVPIVVQFMTSTGQVIQRTYVVGPLYFQRIAVGSVIPNGQFGIVAASNYPFVALNRYWFNFGRGADTSTGIRR